MDLSKLPKLSQTQQTQGSGSGAQTEAGPAASPKAFCTQCGEVVGPGMRFCGKCGAPVTGGVSYADRYAADPGSMADAWVSVILGVIYVLLGWSFGLFLLATVTGQPFHTHVDWQVGPKAGQEVAYFELEGHTAWSESALFGFGAALLVEAGVLLVAGRSTQRRAGIVFVAMGVMLLATAYNLGISVLLISDGFTPYLSLLAVAIGGYSTIFEWRLLRQRA